MNSLAKKNQNLLRRKTRIRKVVIGTNERPRLSVFISNTNISAQIIDDTNQRTLLNVTTVGNKNALGSMTEKAELIGSEIAKRAKDLKIKRIVFDRNGRLYHGRIKSLADKAREGGLEF